MTTETPIKDPVKAVDESRRRVSKLEGDYKSAIKDADNEMKSHTQHSKGTLRRIRDLEAELAGERGNLQFLQFEARSAAKGRLLADPAFRADLRKAIASSAEALEPWLKIETAFRVNDVRGLSIPPRAAQELAEYVVWFKANCRSGFLSADDIPELLRPFVGEVLS